MNLLYYIELDEQQYGPYELKQVKELGLLADTLVLAQGCEEWKPAASFPELANCFVATAIPSVVDIENINYYYKDVNGQLYGPFSIAELAYLDINKNTLLSINNMDNWHYASEIEGLLETLPRLAGLEEEEYDTELQGIRNEYEQSEEIPAKEMLLNETNELEEEPLLEDKLQQWLSSAEKDYRSKLEHLLEKQRCSTSFS
jgi:hypothetical protein